MSGYCPDCGNTACICKDITDQPSDHKYDTSTYVQIPKLDKPHVIEGVRLSNGEFASNQPTSTAPRKFLYIGRFISSSGEVYSILHPDPYQERGDKFTLIEKSAYDQLQAELTEQTEKAETLDRAFDSLVVTKNELAAKVDRLERALKYAMETWDEHPAKMVWKGAIARLERGE
jgi:hypothetical protein